MTAKWLKAWFWYQTEPGFALQVQSSLDTGLLGKWLHLPQPRFPLLEGHMKALKDPAHGNYVALSKSLNILLFNVHIC